MSADLTILSIIHPLNREVRTIRIGTVQLAVVTAVTALTVSCGGGTSPAGPTAPVVSVSSVSPSSGPTIGGTVITVIGSNFAPGAAVTIRGISATDVTVMDSATLTATTGPASAGPGDVNVTSGGRVATLPDGYTYLLVDNMPPVIAAIGAQGTRPNEPSHFADLDEQIVIAAAVSDAETSSDQLMYDWSSEVGTFIGAGATVRWQAPHDLPKTPVTYPLTLTVTEPYQTTDESGAVITKENKVTSSVSVRVHNSYKETRDLAGAFLNDFANSSVSPESAVRDFSVNKCPGGRGDELNDIRMNRATYTINSHAYSFPANVSFNFGGICSFRSRPGDACVDLACRWVSTRKDNGRVETTDGRCYLTEVYDHDDKWRLCWSDFRPSAPLTFDFPF